MAKKISQLIESTVISGSEEFVVNDNGKDRKVSASTLLKDSVRFINVNDYMDGKEIDTSKPFILCMSIEGRIFPASHFRYDGFSYRIDCFMHVMEAGGKNGMLYTIINYNTLKGVVDYSGGMLLNPSMEDAVETIDDKNFAEWKEIIETLFGEDGGGSCKDYSEPVEGDGVPETTLALINRIKALEDRVTELEENGGGGVSASALKVVSEEEYNQGNLTPDVLYAIL